MLGKVQRLLNVWKLGRAYVGGNYEAALNTADVLLERNPGDVGVLMTAAESAYLAGMYGRAYKYAAAATDIERDNLDALLYLVASLVELKQYRDAYVRASEFLSNQQIVNPGKAFEFDGESIEAIRPQSLSNRVKALIQEKHDAKNRLLQWCCDYKSWYEENASGSDGVQDSDTLH